MAVKEITVKELKAWMDQSKDFALIDVREPSEVEIASIGGELIPLGKLERDPALAPSKSPTVVYCRSGGRSMKAARELASRYPDREIYNLKGGILAWIAEIDPSMTPY